ncbi:MAG: baseplate J/gp47 family protein [Defluviitaleaceae bacterium]|nr:baseplate J/gp47 family protein [Defluviitaleaceae bacterium]
MYEIQTYGTILNRMTAAVTAWAAQNGQQVDTREGSLIRTALAPAAYELAQIYIELQRVLDESFADTASWDYLVRRAAERGVVPYPATNAIRQGEFNMDVPIGSRFSLNLLNYVAIAKISDGVFEMRCETPGSVGNLESGRLIPIQYIQGLTRAQLTDVLIPGEDMEGLEHFRKRYFDSIFKEAFGGNIADYYNKVTAMQGVGGCKVYPVWQGPGTVKVVVIDSEWEAPTGVMTDAIQTALDPTVNQGAGLGLAPIGHTVTVAPVTGTQIDISFTLTYQSGYAWADVQDDVNAAIDAYFLQMAQGWDQVDWINTPTATLIVRVSQIETRILDVAGVIDITGTALNGGAANVALDADAIPVKGSVADV